MNKKHQVKVVYNKAVMQANNIDDIANRIDKERKKLSNDKYNLANYWSGDNAAKYKSKMNDRENELVSIAAELRKIAKTIRQVSKTSYEADMRAIEIAQQSSGINKK